MPTKKLKDKAQQLDPKPTLPPTLPTEISWDVVAGITDGLSNSNWIAKGSTCNVFEGKVAVKVYEQGNYNQKVSLLEDALVILEGIAKGIQSLHSKGWIHCDLKPENIFLTKDLKPKIGDFGQTQIEEKSAIGLGTPGHAPPEAKEKFGVQKSWDIYSFGIIMKQMVMKVDDVRLLPSRISVHPSLMQSGCPTEGSLFGLWSIPDFLWSLPASSFPPGGIQHRTMSVLYTDIQVHWKGYDLHPLRTLRAPVVFDFDKFCLWWLHYWDSSSILDGNLDLDALWEDGAEKIN
ncbi:hypothetical protein COLO4_23574 [Corchorus olitorius]|uniref:Protein kinase domain-containing protein n=1 Tax=Corchorus olitorius TaxID=93759 RepID=A0A1R3IG51_9ROSI|nr:hypothetical protein COLO4_23574 [Corchorus olitorius]